MKKFKCDKVRGLLLYVNRRRIFLLSLGFMVLLAAGIVFPLRLASAAPNFLTAGEVMTPINELRSRQGLQPYSFDPGVSAYAQEHSEYQASTGNIDPSSLSRPDILIAWLRRECGRR